jgi:protein kinase X
LIFEMLAGYPPFYADNPLGIYEAILGGKIDWPKSVDGLAKDLIRKAIKKKVLNLGNFQNSVKGISKTIHFRLFFS